MRPVAAEQHRRLPLPAAVASVCLLLTLLLLSQQRLQIETNCGPQMRQVEPHYTGGRSGGSSAASPASPATGGTAVHACRPPAVAPSPWADSCQLLHDACVDQGSIILYGEEHRMTADRPGTAPFLIEPEEHHRKYIFLHRNGVSRPACTTAARLHCAPRGTALQGWLALAWCQGRSLAAIGRCKALASHPPLPSEPPHPPLRSRRGTTGTGWPPSGCAQPAPPRAPPTWPPPPSLAAPSRWSSSPCGPPTWRTSSGVRAAPPRPGSARYAGAGWGLVACGQEGGEGRALCQCATLCAAPYPIPPATPPHPHNPPPHPTTHNPPLRTQTTPPSCGA